MEDIEAIAGTSGVLLSCVTGSVPWTCVLQDREGTPTLIVTMGKGEEQISKTLDLFNLFAEEMDHHPMDDI